MYIILFVFKPKKKASFKLDTEVPRFNEPPCNKDPIITNKI